MITENRGGLSAFVHAERGVWRRGETVHLLALVRGVTGQAPAPVPLRWRFRRPDWKIWREEVVPTLASADVLREVTFPNDLPTGNWQVELTLLGDEKIRGPRVDAERRIFPERTSSLQGFTAISSFFTSIDRRSLCLKYVEVFSHLPQCRKVCGSGVFMIHLQRLAKKLVSLNSPIRRAFVHLPLRIL